MKKKGFILVLTLWVLVAIMLAAAFFSERVVQAVHDAKISEEHTAALLGISDTKAELLFRMATAPNGVYGLGDNNNAVRLDGQLYFTHGSYLELQDMRGLINATQFPNQQLMDLLRLMGIDSLTISRLMDTLQDYQDEDNLRRLNGAEAADYLAVGLPPPPNRPLRSIEELQGILGWRDLNSELLTRLMESMSLGKEVQINLNTAPYDVLRTIEGMDEPKTRRLMAQREIEPLLSINAVAAITGKDADWVMSLRNGVVSAAAVRVNQFAKSLPWVLRYDIVLTPKSEFSPWHINYAYKIPKKERSDHEIPLPALLLQPTSSGQAPVLPSQGGALLFR